MAAYIYNDITYQLEIDRALSGGSAGQVAIAEEELEEGHLGEAEEAFELADLRGQIPNSGAQSYTFGSGITWVGERGMLGVSLGYYDSDYGVPARPGADHHHGEEGEEEAEEAGHEHGDVPVTIAMQQWRGDLLGELETGDGFLEAIRLRLGYAEYEHTEFEGDDVGTVFLSDAWEGRLELIQSDKNGWRGVIGAQAFHRDFEAIGAEAFVAPNQTDQFGIFTLQEFELGAFGLELAARYEHTNVRSDSVKTAIGEDPPTIAVDRTFNALSGAVGLSYRVADQVKLGLTGSRAVRAPSAEELFANGPHIATQAFEVGNPNFALEKSWGLEAYLRGDAGPLRFSLSTYAQWFDDYIYEVETGAEQDELPIYQFLQASARYLGIEAEVKARLIETDGFTLTANLIGDYVNAKIDNGGGDVPRIPAFRLLGGLSAERGVFGGQIEAERVFAQNAVATFETPTSGYTMVNASLSWHPFGTADETIIVLSANNIFDVDARRHASFTKNFVPLAGRDIRISTRFSF